LSALLVPLLGSTTKMAICMGGLQLLGLAMFVAARNVGGSTFLRASGTPPKTVGAS